MWVLPIKKNDSQSLSAASSVTFTTSDVVNLIGKNKDMRKLYLKIDIAAGTAFGQLCLYPEVGSLYSLGTYTSFNNTISGTSLLLNKSTSTSGLLADGSFYYPLIQASLGTGVSEPIRAPYLRLGYRAYKAAVPFTAQLCVG